MVSLMIWRVYPKGMRNILKRVNNNGKRIKDDKKIYIVFNAVKPDILYPINKKNQDLKNLLLDEKLNKLKKFLADKNIAFYDFNEYLLNNYNKKDINTMFKRINNHWDHYTEKGFFKIVEQINKNLIN